jgi:hypothetical protein
MVLQPRLYWLAGDLYGSCKELCDAHFRLVLRRGSVFEALMHGPFAEPTKRGVVCPNLRHSAGLEGAKVPQAQGLRHCLESLGCLEFAGKKNSYCNSRRRRIVSADAAAMDHRHSTAQLLRSGLQISSRHQQHIDIPCTICKRSTFARRKTARGNDEKRRCSLCWEEIWEQN